MEAIVGAEAALVQSSSRFGAEDEVAAAELVEVVPGDRGRGAVAEDQVRRRQETQDEAQWHQELGSGGAATPNVGPAVQRLQATGDGP